MARSTRLLKIALLLAAALVLAIVLIGLYLWRGGTVDRFARGRIIEYLESQYHVKVDIDSVHVDLKRNRLVLKGIKINNQRYPSDPPPIHIRELEVEFMYSLWSRNYRLGDIFVRYPTVRVLEDPNGLLNLTNMFEPHRKTEVKFSLANVGTISIENGNVFYVNQWIPLETRGGGLQSKFFYSPVDDIYRLELRLGELALTKAQQRLRAIKLQADFRLKNEVFSFRKLDFQSDLGELHSSEASFNYHTLQYRFRGNSRINLNRLTYAGFRKAAMHGVVDFSGTVLGVKSRFEFAGKFNSSRLLVREYTFDRLSGDLRADSSKLRSDNLQGQIFGAPFNAKLLLVFSNRGMSEAEGSVRGARIETFLAKLNFPFSNISGSADARFLLRWPGLNFEDSTGSGVVNYSGRITAASDVRKYFPGSLTESLPYQGSASFTKGGAALNVQKGVVTTPGSRIDYSGSVTLAGAYDLRVKLHSANTDELIRAAGLFDAEARRQLEQRAVRSGAAFDFEGTLSGVKSQYRLAGNVISPFLQVKQVRLSNISAALELTPRFVHLENASVQFGRSRITGSIRYPFITRGERIQVDATVQNAQLEDLLALANSRLPLGGLVNARIQVSGPDLQHMDGKAPLVVDHPTFFGEPFDRLTADLIFRESVYEVQNFRLVKGRGLVTGTIAGNVDGSSFNVDLSGRDILLTSIRGGNLQGYQLGGVLNFTIRGNGTLQNLNHTLHAEVRAFTVQGEHLQNLVVDAKAEGKRVDFTAVTNYLNNRLEARGHVLVTDDYPFQATMDLRNAPIRPYMALFGQRPKADLSGLATGRVQASGKLKRLEDASIEARLSSLQLAVNRYQLRNQGEVVLRFEQGVLDIKPVKMVGPDTSLTLSGQVSTLGTQPVSLRISGNANLLVLSAFVPDLNARGNVSLNVYASGSMRQLRILGSANFNKVYLAQPGWPTPLFDTSGSLRFTANQVSIESITAKTRYGTLHIEGGLFLEGLVPSRGRLNITGEGLRIEYPQDVKSTVDIDVDFLKSSTNQLLSGAIYIRNSEYIKNITLADLVLQISNFRALPPARAYGRQEINLDLDVEAYKSIRIKNSLADVLASGLFNVRGTIDEPVILGRMNVDQGKLVLQDSKYQISRGSITFNNPRKTTPVLDFEAETSVRDYTVTINLRGPLDHLTTTFRSDPPLTTSDIVSMLAIGRPIQEVARDSRNREQQSQTLAFHGATTLLSRSLTDKLTARSTRLFGFDRFTIDPFLFTGQNPSARVTLGKQISKDVAVIFATDLSSTQSEVVTIEYTIREGITLVATRTESGAFGLDVKLRKRF